MMVLAMVAAAGVVIGFALGLAAAALALVKLVHWLWRKAIDA